MTGNATPRRLTRRQAAVSAVVLVTVGAIGAGLLLQAGQPGAPVASPGSTPGATTAAGQSPGASSDPGWATVAIGELPTTATLEASLQDATGVPPNATFTLASRTGEPAGAIARRLVVSPAAEFAVAPSADGSRATLTPRAPLTPGRTYRVTLLTPDGARAGSWAFAVRGPVRVTSTIPGDATTGVPIRTGVEVTFDQDGVADMGAKFAISPAVEGSFERHGRTQVFVPKALEPATLYTITIRRGLARTGSDLVLQQDVVFRFETEGAGGPPETRLRFGRDVLETGPGERPVIAVNAVVPELEDGTSGPAPTTARVRVLRFPSLDAAAGALAGFLAAPRWTRYHDPLMPTAGLPVVASFEARLEPLGEGEDLLLRFPEALDEGWYVVEIPGSRVAQAFIQVTPVSAWVAVLSDKTVVWVNDVSTGRPVRDATVVVDGAPLDGRSDADGLAISATPARVVPPAAAEPGAAVSPLAPILRVTTPAGKAVLVPFDVDGYGNAYRGEWSEKTAPADATYWAMLFTDRYVYRADDTVEVWGYLRGRDDGGVPASVDVRLVSTAGDRSTDAPGIASVTARPGRDGTFTASLRLADVPLGNYEVLAVVDGRMVVSRWLEVTVIRKPPYQLALVPNHTAVITGTRVEWAANATFFDGSPVPALDIRFQDPNGEDDHGAQTDAAGRATLSLVARSDDDQEGATDRSSQVTPAGPEGAEISAGSSVLVFPTAYHLTATGTVESGRLTVDGSIHEVDLAKVERALAAGTWDGDAAGDAVGGKRIGVVVTELIPVRRQVGSEYDFIEKIVRPHYEYDITRKPFDTLTTTSAADGRIRFSLAVPNPGHEYEVVLSVKDGAGRVQKRTLQAGRPFAAVSDPGVLFEEADGRTAGDKPYGIGDRIAWRITDDGAPFPSGGADRYLYLVAQRGLRSAAVSDSATVRRTFAAADAPGVFIIGVRFTGTTYAPKAAAWANFDQEERGLKVTVTADKARYEPGETATLSVRTTDTTGRPVAASVILQAVDEKLFAMGGAEVPRPLDDLYQRVDSGILRLTATHQLPGRSGMEGEGGDTTGGGRSDFRDTLVFRSLLTDTSGRASTTVKLSDDLTSWHVSAVAATADLRAGVGERLVPVGLPFFVEATVADSYLASDRPVVRLRAFGDALRAGDPVEFSVESPTLGMPATRVTGKAFEPASVALPALSIGQRSIVVSGTATTRTGRDGKALTDRLTRTFEIIESRLTAIRTAFGTVGDSVPSVAGSSGLTRYTFTDAGRGRLLPLLIGLADPAGLRLDRLIAQSIARGLLVEAFGREPATLPPLELDSSRYPLSDGGDGESGATTPGVGLLPYGGPDPWLAARVAIAAPDALNRESLRAALLAIPAAPTTKRDLAIAALAGLASLGEPVLADLRAAGLEPDLSPSERLYLALGLAAAGDESGAISIERDLLARHGERLGAWVRLDVGGDLDTTVEGTSLMAMLAARLGDPLAADMAAFVLANPSPEAIHDLDMAAYAASILERAPRVSGSFAYTVDGRRTVVVLEPGEAFELALTGAQQATLRLEPVLGTVGVAVEARVVVDPAAIVPHGALTLTRTTPGSPVATDRIVVVTLSATFGPSAPSGCYDVVEQVPSGLAPLSLGNIEPDETGVTWPTSVVGQEVRFCADNDARTGHAARMQYRARVVNAGAFAWEPALMQLPGAPELIAITAAGSVAIGAP